MVSRKIDTRMNIAHFCSFNRGGLANGRPTCPGITGRSPSEMPSAPFEDDDRVTEGLMEQAGFYQSIRYTSRSELIF